MKKQLFYLWVLVAVIMVAVITVTMVSVITKKQGNSTPKDRPINTITSQTPSIVENPVLAKNPTFNEVVLAGCGDTNPYIGKQVQWKAQISDYAHTNGIRFIVIDKDHSQGSAESHGHFWGTFLVSADDPRSSEEGLRKWAEQWQSSWVEYILDVYGGIGDNDRNTDTQFLVDAVIDYVTCEEKSEDNILYDGGYIETSVKKITVI